MSSLLSRRGFTRIALAGGAGLCLPTFAGLASADDAPRWSGRLEAGADREYLSIGLFLRHAGTTTVDIPGDALRLDAAITGARRADTVRLTLEPMARPVSRAFSGREAPTRVLVPAEREVHYARFIAPWPAGFPLQARGELRARPVLAVEGSSRPDDADAAALRALGALDLAVRVVRPA